MKKKWKIILGAVFGIIVLLTLVIQYTRPLETALLTVKKEDIAKTFREEGIVKATKETYVSSVYGGKISSVHVREGDLVEQNAPLVSFDDQEILYQIQSLQAQMRSIEAQKDLQELTIDLEAMKLLYEAGAISKKEYEDAKNTVSSEYYPALIASVQAQINQLNYQLSLSKCTSPVPGIVAGLSVEEGMVVPPGTPLMTIFNPESYIVETYVLTEDAAGLEPGMEVTLVQKNKSGDILFSGIVDLVAPSAVEKISPLGLIEQRIKVTIIPEIAQDLVLKPGYALDVEFIIDKQENQLVVPKTALFPYLDGDALWLVKNGKAVIQPVKTVFENDRNAAITEGLTEGDLVVLNPKTTGLKEGKRIKIKS
jgi:HlyD family secretion protein